MLGLMLALLILTKDKPVMATWHQLNAPQAPLFHATEWTVVIDPPHQMRALVRFSSKDLADVYVRGLKANNPGAAAHSYVLKPASAARKSA